MAAASRLFEVYDAALGRPPRALEMFSRQPGRAVFAVR